METLPSEKKPWDKTWIKLLNLFVVLFLLIFGYGLLAKNNNWWPHGMPVAFPRPNTVVAREILKLGIVLDIPLSIPNCDEDVEGLQYSLNCSEGFHISAMSAKSGIYENYLPSNKYPGKPQGKYDV